MPNSSRIAAAKAAALLYAPPPDGSTVTYGIIGVALLGLCLAAYGGFYAVDVLANPVAAGAGALVAFASGAAFRVRQRLRYERALSTQFGPTTLASFSVITRQVELPVQRLAALS